MIVGAGMLMCNIQRWIFKTPNWPHDFVIPSDCNKIRVKLWGCGGKSGDASNGDGGAGGFVQCDLAVTPGETLRIVVGGIDDGTGGTVPSGNGHTGTYGYGGGYSAVSRTGQMLALAGGGGGGGEGPSGGFTDTGKGGAGGGLVGEAGTTPASPTPTAGGGGTQSYGGAKGESASAGYQATPGIAYRGGNGGYPLYASGGGGGGGRYGGGGGGADEFLYAAGGGGGSSYTDPAATNVLNLAGTGTQTPNKTDPDYPPQSGTTLFGDGDTSGSYTPQGYVVIYPIP